MKLILGHDMATSGKVLLDDGTDITKDLMVNAIEIKAECGKLTHAILTVYPSEIVMETEDGSLEFKKHSDWDLIKK